MYYNTRFSSIQDYLRHAKIFHLLGDKELMQENAYMRDLFRKLRKKLHTLVRKGVNGVVLDDVYYLNLLERAIPNL